MELDAETADAYVRHAYAQILAVVDRLGDERLNVRPHGSHTNGAGAIATHCLGVLEFWLGHVALGRPTTRDRDAEFVATPTVAELHERVEAGLAQASDDLRRIAAGEARPGPDAATLEGGAGADSVVLHVLEETYQHLGQMELTADALLADG